MVTLTQTQFLLLDMIISNAIRAALDEISNLSQDEVDTRIQVEQSRKADLMSRLQSKH